MLRKNSSKNISLQNVHYNSPQKTHIGQIQIESAAHIKVDLYKLHQSTWLSVKQTSALESEEQLFFKLFTFISNNKIPMTTPVIKSSDGKSMSFFTDQKNVKSDSNVIVHTVNEQAILVVVYPSNIDFGKVHEILKSNEIVKNLNNIDLNTYVIVENEEPTQKTSKNNEVWFF